MTVMITFAMFGLAHMHLSALYSSLSQLPKEAVCIGWAETPAADDQDPTKKAITSLGRANGVVPKFDSWTELADKKPDLALVCTDNAEHAEIACALMKRGIAVVLEKPIASTYADAKKMVDCANESGVKFAVNWPIAWFPSFNLAKKLYDEGKIGRLMRVTYRSPATWGPFSYSKDGSIPPVESLKKTWWYRHERGGGSILDYACYGAALSTWFFGKRAKTAWGIAKAFAPEAVETGVEDFSAMMFDFGDGIGLLEGSWSTYNCGQVPSGPILHGTKGTIVCDRHTNKVRIYSTKSHGNSEPTEVIECPSAEPELNFGRNIIDYLTGKNVLHPLLTPELNLSVMAALEAGRQSASMGVTLPQ